MARNKPQPKPLFSVKQDFVESLDAFTQAVIVFHQAVKAALDLGAIKEGPAKLIREKLEALDKAMMSEDGG